MVVYIMQRQGTKNVAAGLQDGLLSAVAHKAQVNNACAKHIAADCASWRVVLQRLIGIYCVRCLWQGAAAQHMLAALVLAMVRRGLVSLAAACNALILAPPAQQGLMQWAPMLLAIQQASPAHGA